MADTGFPGGLDPRAAEFRPTYPYNYNNHNQLLPFSQPQIYYSYPCHHPYPHFTVPPPQPAYVSSEPPPLPPTLPPPSTTPSRTLLISSVPPDVSESTVRRELEVFGDVRAVQMERVSDGIVTVHFYDLRNAKEALVEIQNQHMQQQFRLRLHFEAALTHNSLSPYGPSNIFLPPVPPPARGLISGHAVWAQFIFPVTNGLPHGHNQGTIVIFNLDQDVSAATLREIFEAFGPIKELRETPLKRHQRFIEFYDIRNADKALEEMNSKEICGKNVVVEFSRPGGHSKRFSRIALNHTMNSLPRPPLPLPLPMTPSPCKYPGNDPTHRPSTRYYYNPQAQVFSKKGDVNSGRNRSVVDQFESGFGNGIMVCNSKKSGKKSHGTSSVASSTGSMKQYNTRGGGGSRPWKGSRQAKDKFDPRFLINEDGIMLESNCRDSRTTVMIKNIPNKYSQKLLLNMLDNHCIHCNEQIADGDDQPLSSYDFVYLPIDFINKCNVGYGFVNMTSPQATWRLYKAFHHQNWEVFNSRKICEVTYARLQGVEALKEHFKNSKFPSEAEEYMPVVFSPPRDGRRLTEPNPIVGLGLGISNLRRHNYSSPSPVTSEGLINDQCLSHQLLLLVPEHNPANSDSSNSVNHINEVGDGVCGTSSVSVSSNSGTSGSSQNGGVNGDD